MFYRIHQFWQALFPQIQAEEAAWLEANLGQKALSLFYTQTPADQRHALDVAKSITVHKSNLTKEEYQILFVAALLHDCGKSLTKVRLWHRIFIVLAQRLPTWAWSFLENSSTPLAVPLTMSTRHADWGAELAAKARLDHEICILIQKHHSPNSRLGYILAEADNTN